MKATIDERRDVWESERREVPVFGYAVTIQTTYLQDKPVNVLRVKDHDGLSVRMYLSNAEAFALAHELMRGVRPA